MNQDRNGWSDGRRAWERLDGWHQDGPAATPGHPDDGEAALSALDDLGLLRHLLDQAELVAVRTARRHGKSWAEIATKLGVTRQSAWERWRDLDETGPDKPAGRGSRPEATAEVDAADAATLAAETSRWSGDAPADLIEYAARGLRRRSTIVVPNVIGMSWPDARQALHEKLLVAVGPDLDAPPPPASAWPDRVVIDQSPEAGARVPAGASVMLWLERGGGSGVREPRRPKPGPKTARELPPEPSTRAVG